MSDLSPDFAAHLAGECTTLCHCWLVERRDGVRFGFTDHDMALEIDGTSHAPQTGLTRSEARDTLGMAVDATDVEGALSSDAITQDDIAAGLFDGATVTTMLVNWAEPAQRCVLRSATVGTVRMRDGRFVAELESRAAALDRPNGRTLSRRCDAELGDARCGVALAPLTAAGTVIGTAGPAMVGVEGLEGHEAGRFSFGRVTWTGGALGGRGVTVVDHRVTGDGVVIVLPAGAAMPETGDTFSIVAGCDKRFQTCREKFGNGLNFRGFPHLPGNDAAYGYVSEGVFDGGALVE